MGIRVGVVCEGSHDFHVLTHFIDQIIRHFGETVDAIDCLQPEVSASFQVTSGGWTQVHSWCLSSSGQGYRKYVDKPLFSTSKPYDILVIHLDGDVVTHCNSDPLAGLSADNLSVSDIIQSLEDAILKHWLSIDSDHKEKIVACIPVRHLEAWLSAAIGPSVADHQATDMKATFRTGPVKSIPGSWRSRYITAAKAAVGKFSDIRATCSSFERFESNLKSAIESA